MANALAVQIKQAEVLNRIADSVNITIKDVAPAPPMLPAPIVPTITEIAPPAFDMAHSRVDLLPRLASTGAHSLLLGMDADGNEVRGDLNTLMHTGLLAQTGGGKTTTLAAYGLQLASDPRVLIAIADPHMMELALLEDTGAFWKSAPTNARQAVAILKDTQKEIHRRAELVNRVSQHVQNQTGRRCVLNSLARYNTVAARVNAEQLPALVLFADEIKALAALSDDTDEALQSITSEGRKFGVYFVGASQSWKADVINTDVKSQFWTRIALYGAAFRQVAELFEVSQPEAKAYTAQLLAPGCAAIWQRSTGVQVLKTPYIDLESDAVYGAMELIRTRRNSEGSTYVAPSTIDALPTATMGATTGAIAAFQSPKTALLGNDATMLELGHKAAKVTVTADERSTILAAAQTATSRRSLCKELFSATGGAAYDKVKLVCDEAGVL